VGSYVGCLSNISLTLKALPQLMSAASSSY
jgi:hypothetical protein